MPRFRVLYFLLAAITLLLCACSGLPNSSQTKVSKSDVVTSQPAQASEGFLNAPLVSHMFTADPSAHSFDGKIYVYPSHDWDSDKPLGGADQFDMKDYHVFSMDDVGKEVTDHGVALHINDVPWAKRQMWAPDAARKDGKYYLYFPAKDHDGIFRIGAAVSDSPVGPFKAQPLPIEGSYSIDPSVFQDDDGSYYMYIGGIWGGQLEHWDSENNYSPQAKTPADDEPALLPRIAKMADDMLSFAEALREVQILDENGELIKQSDNARRFFEAAWIHKHAGMYYLSYSTGDTHLIQYATSSSPYGPFTYQGKVLEPVLGWTNHHSIVKHNNKWFLFYHDTELSGGQTHLRNIKAVEIKHDANNKIIPVDAYLKD